MANNGAHNTVTTEPLDRATPDVSLSVAGVAGGGGDPAVTNWQLPSANYVAAKRPLQIIQPHPNQTGPDSIYLWAEPGEKYEVPISAIFGAYPYHFNVDGPAGMTVGSFLALAQDGVTLIRPEIYGVVSFDVPASGMTSFSYTVTITDQQLNAQSVTVNVTVDASKFVHLAPLGVGVGDGSSGSPLGSFEDVWKNDNADATYAGKILRIHGGNYNLKGDPNNNGNVVFDGALKPKVWVAKSGETPVFDCSTAKILFNDGNMDDCAFIGNKFINGRQDVGNAHFIWVTSNPERMLIWRNEFRNLGYGTDGRDNPACIFISSSGAVNPVVLSNEFYELPPGQGNGVAAYDTYNILEGLFEDNYADNSTADYLFWHKGQHVYCTIRSNRVGPNFTGKNALCLSFGADGGASLDDGFTHGVEICYNQIASASTSFFMAWSSTSDTHYDIWAYRNSGEGNWIHLHTDTSEWTLEKNIATNTIPTGTAITSIDNQEILTSEIDADGALSGNAAQYRGTHGSTITGEV